MCGFVRSFDNKPRFARIAFSLQGKLEGAKPASKQTECINPAGAPYT